MRSFAFLPVLLVLALCVQSASAHDDNFGSFVAKKGCKGNWNRGCGRGGNDWNRGWGNGNGWRNGNGNWRNCGNHRGRGIAFGAPAFHPVYGYNPPRRNSWTRNFW